MNVLESLKSKRQRLDDKIREAVRERKYIKLVNRTVGKAKKVRFVAKRVGKLK